MLQQIVFWLSANLQCLDFPVKAAKEVECQQTAHTLYQTHIFMLPELEVHVPKNQLIQYGSLQSYHAHFILYLLSLYICQHPSHGCTRLS